MGRRCRHRTTTKGRNARDEPCRPERHARCHCEEHEDAAPGAGKCRHGDALVAVQTPARWTVPEYRTHVLEDARRQLETVLTKFATVVDARVQVAAGPTAEAILDEAEAINADLVVVGRSSRFRPARIDSTADAATTRALCWSSLSWKPCAIVNSTTCTAPMSTSTLAGDAFCRPRPAGEPQGTSMVEVLPKLANIDDLADPRLRSSVLEREGDPHVAVLPPR